LLQLTLGLFQLIPAGTQPFSDYLSRRRVPAFGRDTLVAPNPLEICGNVAYEWQSNGMKD